MDRRRTAPGRRPRETALVGACLLLALLPVFFETYRVMIFHAVPRDDYAPYLLHLLGEEGGRQPGSPFGYRALAVLAAAPFYYLLPPIRFSLLPPGIDPAYLRATQALAFASYLAIAGGALIVFRTLRDRLETAPSVALAAALAYPLLIHYTALHGIDAVSLFWVALCLYFLDRPAVFSPLLLLSVTISEKVALAFLVLLAARLLGGPRSALSRYRWQMAGVAAALAGYAVVVTLVALPGHEEQWELGGIPGSVLGTLRLDLTLRGVASNLVPTAIALGTYLVAARRLPRAVGAFYHRADVLLPLGLFAAGHVVDVHFNVGRVVMVGLPLYVVALALMLETARKPTAGDPGAA